MECICICTSEPAGPEGDADVGYATPAKPKNSEANATNLSREIRGPLVDLFTAYGARTRIVYVEAPCDRLFAQNRERVRQVPDEADRIGEQHLALGWKRQAANGGIERGEHARRGNYVGLSKRVKQR